MKTPTSFLAATILFVLGIFSIGFIATVLLSHRIERIQRESLLVEAKQAALLVSAGDIASLSGSRDDLSNPVYQHLKTQLMNFRQADPHIRFVYVMGYRPELRTQFFYVDSEPTTSTDYSPPGQLYGDTRESDIKNYLAGEPYADGPYQDSWGEWLSGYVPLKNEQGSVIAMIGIDMATSVLSSQIAFMRLMVGVIAMLLSVIVLIISINFYNKLRSLNALSKQNQQLSLQQVVLKHMQQLAQVGTFIIQFPDGNLIIDEQFVPLFKSTKMDKEVFRTFVHVDDQEKYEAMIKEITSSNIVYSWVDIRIGTTEAGFRKYHIYGNIERHASGPAERFDGVIQDITDIK